MTSGRLAAAEATSLRDWRQGILGPKRHWLIDAGLGAAGALAAITLAHAALPNFHVAPTSRPAPSAVQASRQTPAEPAALIAFVDPAAGTVVSPFGLRQLPWEASGRLHEGIDIQAATGEVVRAAADGVVAERGTDPGYGRFVAIRHAEGLTTLYAHLSAIDPRVTPGLALKAGEALGAIGSTGSSTGPHLHFEIRDARDHPLNPVLFLGHAFADADDLPLARAQRFGRRVRIAQVSVIPASKRVLMAERAAAADAMSAGADAVAHERMGGLHDLHIGPDGRPRAQLGL